MSLFEDETYLYRDTFFVLFEAGNRPSGTAVRDCIATIDEKCLISDLKATDGAFDSVTVKSPHDRAAMDIVFVQGEEVIEQIADLIVDFQQITLTGDEMGKLKSLKTCTARMDVFHFEEASATDSGDMLDPGGLLLVMEKLVGLPWRRTGPAIKNVVVTACRAI